MKTSWLRRFFSLFMPRSLLSRMLLLLLLAIVLAQSLISGIWMQQLEKRELEGMLAATRDLANSAASTVSFFKSLPLQYRPIALDQLRNMGGSRFFVSLNKEEIMLNGIPDSPKKQVVLKEVNQTLLHKLGQSMQIKTDFSYPAELHVFNNETLLSDIPPSWSRYTLLMEPINPPILVTQIKLENGDWLYLAALLPAPYMTLDEEVVSPHQFRFIILLTIILFPFTFALVRWQTRPLRHLAAAAVSLGKDIDQPPLPEAGASEIVAVTRAINIMQQRIRRYISDREKLFSSISHDLKTPITRLRLRVELLDDDTQFAKFSKDLDDLEMMVKGALQTVKDFINLSHRSLICFVRYGLFFLIFRMVFYIIRGIVFYSVLLVNDNIAFRLLYLYFIALRNLFAHPAGNILCGGIEREYFIQVLVVEFFHDHFFNTGEIYHHTVCIESCRTAVDSDNPVVTV